MVTKIKILTSNSNKILKYFPDANQIDNISQMIEDASKNRGTGIAKRPPEYIKAKIEQGKAVLAFDLSFEIPKIIGFCYIEDWSNKNYIATSGLIIDPDYRGKGLAKKIKKKAVKLAHQKYPNSKLFGITTSAAVMKINNLLGYKAVPFKDLTQDDEFWKGCQSCPNYDILQRMNREVCLCTAMIKQPKQSFIKQKLNKFLKWLTK